MHAPSRLPRRVGLVLVVALFLLATVDGLSLESATYTVKEAPLFGNTYKYAMFEAQFDEDLQIMRQSPCQCVNSSLACGSSSSKLAPTVNENVSGPDGNLLHFNEMQEGVWFNSSILNTYDSEYAKFTVSYDPSRPCPIIVFEFQQEVGTLSAFLSARFIPTGATADFSHPFQSSSTLVICPTQPQFYYGTYYVYIQNQAGRSTNIYAMRYTIQQSPTCLAPSTADVSAIPVQASSRWLQDGVAHSYTSATTNLFYQLYTEGRCTNFSVAVYRTSLQDAFSFLFVSTNVTNPNANAMNLVQWHALFPDPYVNIQYCNPDPSATFNVFYIGQSFQANVGTYQMVATVQQYQTPVSLSSMAYTQSRLEMSYGISPTLQCDTSEITCTYFPYRGCEFQPIGCCRYFTPVPPEEHVQAVWPWNAGDNSVAQYHLGINWADMQPLKPGKMAWSLLLEWSTATTRTITSNVDPSTCKVLLRNNLMSPTGESLTIPSIAFSKKEVACDAAEYQRVTAKMDALMATYVNAKDDVNEVALQQLRVVIASWNDVYDACKNLVLDSFADVMREYAQDQAYVCNYRPYTAAWAADPCCNPLLKSTTSCRPTTVNRLLPITGSVNSQVMEKSCANPECSTSSVQTYLDTTNQVMDETTGCQDALSQRASVNKATDLLVFTVECKKLVEGPDLLGARCTTSDDCYKNAACSPTTGRCAYTPDDVLDCMANRVSFDTALGLYSVWGISGRPDNESLLAAFQSRWKSEQCIGPQASRHRRGFVYTLGFPGCTDHCLLNDYEPFCVDSAKSRTAACEISSFCDKSVNTSSSICFRYWQPTISDETGCLDERICNWRRDDSFPCPIGRTWDCQADCLSGSADVCMDCSRDISGSCLEIASITTESRCNQGLCSTNSSIVDPTECELAGTCTAKCPGCDEAQCTSTGACSDFSEFRTWVDAGATGVCMRPRFWVALTQSYMCTSPATTLKGWGCAFLNTALTEATCTGVAHATAFWVPFADSEATCTTNSGYGCWSTSLNFWWMRNQTECAICPDCVWKPHYTWSAGQWTPGRMQELTWAPRSYYGATSWASSVDYSVVTRDVNAAITRDFAFAYYTDSLCRYDSVNNLVQSIVCDCATEEQSQCFQNRDKALIGSTSVCPYQSRTVETSVGVTRISDTVVPLNSGCHEVDIAMTSVGKYQVPPDHSVTHALFNKIEKNPYLIVINDKDAVVGQLISDAATLTFEFEPASPISLCIFVADFIEIDSAATTYTLAKVRSDNSIEVFMEGATYTRSDVEAYTASANSSRLQVCGDITESGTYFAVAVVPNYKKLESRPGAETIAAACIYAALGVFVIVQGVLLIVDRNHQKLMAFKMTALVIILVNVGVRMAYVLLPTKAFKKGSESVAFIVFELPTFLYFSVFTVIVYLWVIVVLNTRHFGKKSAMNKYRPLVRSLFAAMNIFMYFIFVAFIFMIAIMPQATKQSPCFLGSLDSAVTSIERTIKISYWIFQLVISVILALGFAVSTVLLLNIIRKLNRRNLGRQEGQKGESRRAIRRANETDVQMIIITVVAFVCVVFLLVRSAIFLDVAVNGTTLHVIVFCMLEVVPQTMLVFYLHPFRCFREAGRRSTTGSSSSKATTFSRGRTSATGGQSHASSHVDEEMSKYSSDPDENGDDGEDDSDGSDSSGSEPRLNGNGIANGHHVDPDSSDDSA
jgi:hypothetical protein